MAAADMLTFAAQQTGAVAHCAVFLHEQGKIWSAMGDAACLQPCQAEELALPDTQVVSTLLHSAIQTTHLQDAGSLLQCHGMQAQERVTLLH